MKNTTAVNSPRRELNASPACGDVPSKFLIYFIYYKIQRQKYSCRNQHYILRTITLSLLIL